MSTVLDSYLIASSTLALLIGVVLGRFLQSWFGRFVLSILGIWILIQILWVRTGAFDRWLSALADLAEQHPLIPILAVLGFLVAFLRRRR